MEDKHEAVIPAERASAQHRWLPLSIPKTLPAVDLTEISAVCGQALILRVSPDPDGLSQLEAYCAPGEEHARAEALIHQAAVDQALRKLIKSRSDPEISALVDGVLSRAVRG